MPKKIMSTSIFNLLIMESKEFGDSRCLFFESFKQQGFSKTTALDVRFAQDNRSRSPQRVLRGLNCRLQQAQGKPVRVVRDEVLDLVADNRKIFSAFGRSAGGGADRRQSQKKPVSLGFAHCFVALLDAADYSASAHERCIAWNDSSIGITWPQGLTPQLSAEDQAGLTLTQAEVFA